MKEAAKNTRKQEQETKSKKALGKPAPKNRPM